MKRLTITTTVEVDESQGMDVEEITKKLMGGINMAAAMVRLPYVVDSRVTVPAIITSRMVEDI